MFNRIAYISPRLSDGHLDIANSSALLERIDKDYSAFHAKNKDDCVGALTLLLMARRGPGYVFYDRCVIDAPRKVINQIDRLPYDSQSQMLGTKGEIDKSHRSATQFLRGLQEVNADIGSHNRARLGYRDTERMVKQYVGFFSIAVNHARDLFEQAQYHKLKW